MCTMGQRQKTTHARAQMLDCLFVCLLAVLLLLFLLLLLLSLSLSGFASS